MDLKTILIALIVFFVVIFLLLALLIYAKAKLTASGTVILDINDGEKRLDTEVGSTLLTSLSQREIFLPSGCGGGGTCGLCKCQVLDGGGDILPTEVNFFTRREQKEHWRLGCQVKVRQEMKLRIPEDILGVRKWECEVVSNRNVATFIKELIVKLPEGESLNFKSGGYIQIDIPIFDSPLNFSSFDIEPEYHEDWDGMNMWNLSTVNREETFRAYSMANHPAEANIVMLNIRISTPPWDRAKGTFMTVNPGVSSSYAFSLKAGDKIIISGPFGDFFVKDTPNEKMFIGGGAGMAPMRSHIFNLFKTQKTKTPVSFWYGARSLKEVFYDDQFREIETESPNFNFHVALSEPKERDNWKGPTGFIHQVIFDNYLSNHPDPEDIEYYLCGPPAMIAAAMKMLDNLGVPAENVMFDDFGE